MDRIRGTQGHNSYELYAFVAHIGSSVRSGHYVCYAQGEDGVWRQFNDSSVTAVGDPVSLQYFGTETPYVLFYRRKYHS